MCINFDYGEGQQMKEHKGPEKEGENSREFLQDHSYTAWQEGPGLTCDRNRKGMSQRVTEKACAVSVFEDLSPLGLSL